MRAPLIMGIDPARTGDRTSIAFRRGREVPKILKWEFMDEMKLAGIVADLIRKYDVDKAFIDVGYGHGTLDRLNELGYSSKIMGVHFSHSPLDDTYLNKRAEMWCLMRKWFHDGGVNIPDNNELNIDLASCPDFEPSSNGKIKLPSKKDIRKVSGFSPDMGDALALTFAYPVFSKEIMERTQNFSRGGLSQSSSGGLRRKKRA